MENYGFEGAGLPRVVLAHPDEAARTTNLLKHRVSTPLFSLWQERYSYFQATVEKDDKSDFCTGDERGVIVLEDDSDVENHLEKFPKGQGAVVPVRGSKVTPVLVFLLSYVVTFVSMSFFGWSAIFFIIGFAFVVLSGVIAAMRVSPIKRKLGNKEKVALENPTSVFPVRDEYFTVDSATCDAIVSILETTENNRSVIRTMCEKMISAETAYDFSSWVKTVEKILGMEAGFPLDFIPVLNEDLYEVHQAVIRKVAERKRLAEQLEAPAKEYEKKFRAEDSETAKRNALDYLEITD